MIDQTAPASEASGRRFGGTVMGKAHTDGMVALWVVAGAIAMFAACDSLECGPGTHRDGDECIPNAQVVCGEGTYFEFGRCWPEELDASVGPDGSDNLVCGAGTHREGDECIPDDTPQADARVQADSALQADVGVIEDAGPIPETGAVDAEPVPPDAAAPVDPCEGRERGVAPADCGDMPGRAYCVTGVALEFTNNCALPSDQNLIAYLIDPVEAAAGGDPAEYTRGFAAIGPGGTFAILAVTESRSLAIVIDESPDADQDVWTRSVSGISAGPSLPGVYPPATVFASNLDTEGRWAQALGHDEGFLQANGFLVGRVLTPAGGGLAPLANAEVVAEGENLAACDEGESCLRFFDDDLRLTGFQPIGERRTSASGAFLVIRGGAGALRAVFAVAEPADIYNPIEAGANSLSGFHIVFVPAP